MAKEQGTALVSPEELKRQAEAQAAMLNKIATAGKFISFKGGQIIIDGKAIPGAKTEVIVLAFMPERAYFPGAFDPDNRQSPLCYAYRENDDEAKPHPEAKEAQAKSCDECQWNKWGSADRGKGKACRESVRIAVMPAQTDLSKAQVWHARIPITSVANFKGFVGDVIGMGKPICSVVAKLTVVPDAKTFFKIQWEMARPVQAKDAAFVLGKAAGAQAAIAFPYPNFEEEEAAAPKALKKGKRAK